MILFNWIILSVTLVISGVAQAQSVDSLFIRKLADEILLRSNAYENLRVLTKSIGPRLAGSSGMVKAEKWGLAAMQAAGADKAWMQECMVPHWVRGGVDKASTMVNLGDGKRGISLDVVALGNSMGSGPKGVTAEVLEVKSFEELESKKEQVKGKIVFYNYPFNATFVRTFQAYGDASKYRGQGPSQAAKYGAVGTIIRSMSHGANNHPHTGATRYDSQYAKIPAVAIGLEHADQMSQWLKKQSLQVKLETHGYFLPDTIGHNIIGELAGTEFPDQIITVGGHLDSWDNCEGAHDDGQALYKLLKYSEPLRRLVISPGIPFALYYLPTRKMDCAEEVNMQLKQRKKMNNTFLP
jgi:carboxypeptidase Q